MWHKIKWNKISRGAVGKIIQLREWLKTKKSQKKNKDQF
jgi:hypothetical protein